MMALLALLYVSRSQLADSDTDAALRAIIDRSVDWNGSVGITGALVHTGTHFAQILEGPANEVEALMARIAVDSRHTEVTIVWHAPLARRRFEGWSMAYCGTAVFMRDQVKALLAPGASATGIDRLQQLMRELAAAGGVSQR